MIDPDKYDFETGSKIRTYGQVKMANLKRIQTRLYDLYFQRSHQGAGSIVWFTIIVLFAALKKMKNVGKCIFLSSILLNSSCKYDESEIKLSGDYRIITYRSIESRQKEYLYKNIIYPIIIHSSYDSSYILAEQLIDSAKIIEHLSSILYDRFQKYDLFLKKPQLFKDTFYLSLDGPVQRDSTLYRLFKSMGAAEIDTPYNIGISVDVAKWLVKNDNYYKKIFNSPNSRCYWIIKLKSDTLIGPLTKKEYIEYRYKMHIPQKIWLP